MAGRSRAARTDIVVGAGLITVADRDEAARAEILARLAESREELRRRLDPPPNEAGGESQAGDYPGGFPRSRTMKMLMSSRGIGTVGAMAAGLLIARPAVALRLLRMLPVSAVARMLMVKAFSGLRRRKETPP
jgi:hypothetical protein